MADSDFIFESRDHARGCPEDPGRVERYEVRRPENQGGGQALVLRCQECGGQRTILPEEREAVTA